MPWQPPETEHDEVAPPRFASALIRLLVPGERGEDFITELNLVYENRRAQGGFRLYTARLWYWSQALSLNTLKLRWTQRRMDAAAEGKAHPRAGHRRRRSPAPKETAIQNIVADLRHAISSLRKRPAFVASVLLTLGIGIGSATAVFGIAKAVVFDPLPFPDSDRLVSLRHEIAATEERAAQVAGLSTGSYFVYGRDSRLLEGLAVYGVGSATVEFADGSETVSAAQVSPTLFETLRVRPDVGRPFTDSDSEPNAAPVAVLGHGFWASRFGGDVGVIGGSLTIDGVDTRIVGVMPPGFSFPTDSTALWTALPLDPSEATAVNFYLGAVARLSTGASPRQAQAEVRTLFPRVFEEYPGEISYEEVRSLGLDATVRQLKETVIGDLSRFLWILVVLVVLIVVVVCTNVFGLVLVQAENASRNMAIRRALGARFGRLAQGYIVENMVLVIAGGAVGLLVAYYFVRTVVVLKPVELPRVANAGLDLQVVAFAVAVSLAVGLVVGLLPLLRLRRAVRAYALGQSSRWPEPGCATSRARKFLVVTQLAIALALSVCAGLMIRTIGHLRSADPGLETLNLLSLGLTLPPKYASGEEMIEFHESMLDRLRALPGVEAASAGASTFGLPLQSEVRPNPVWVENFPTPPGELPRLHSIRIVMGDYFRTLGIPLQLGRPIRGSDLEGGTGAVVVSQAFADQYWSGDSPIGKRIQPIPDGPWFTIVGVAGNVLETGVRGAPESTLYIGARGAEGFFYTSPASMRYAIRTTIDPETLAEQARNVIHEADEELAPERVITMKETLEHSMAGTAFVSNLLIVAALVAVFLALVGTYGVVAFAVARRTREIGLRMAVGANSRAIVGLVIQQSSGMILLGIGVGVGVAFGLARVLESLLFGVRATDPATYLALAVGLALVAALASYAPARRAARVDPAITLRHP